MSGSQSDPNAARARLQRVVENNGAAMEDFLSDPRELTEAHLELRFPYRGPAPYEFAGLPAMLLIQWAEDDIGAFNFLRRVIGHMIRTGQRVPEVWRDFHAGLVEGNVTQPAPERSGRKSV